MRTTRIMKLTPEQFLIYLRDTCLLEIKYSNGKWFINNVEYMLTGKDGIYDRISQRDYTYYYLDKKANRKQFVKYMIENKTQGEQ